MPQIPELIEMLKNGVHFGHQVSKRHPKMMPFIFGARNQISIIDLEKTAEELKKALDFVTKIVATDGVVLFVSSKDQAKDIVKKEGVSGLLFRGLKTKILTNGLQGVLFTVLWKTLE